MYGENNNNNAASYNAQMMSSSNRSILYAYWLQVYLVLVVICNFTLLFWNSNGGDTGFWEDWVKQLLAKGYTDFNGNYPPIYIHWLSVCSFIYSYLQMPVENNIFLKYLTQIPILLSHLSLTGIIFFILKSCRASPIHFHTSLLLTVLNPAILFNGPIWGQIDILPVVPVIIGLLAGISARYKIYAFPFYTLGLLTKFQMIAFAPVFGVLFFLDYKTHLKAVGLCLLVILVAFLPYIFTHHFFSAIKLAYIDVLHQYGTTTMGASNIWILLTGNAAPDSIILFGVDSSSPLAIIFKAKHFGMISFSCVCLCVFIQGVSNLRARKYTQTSSILINDILFYAVICSMAFFTLLPAMHERYLLPAVITSLVYFAVNPAKAIYPIAFSFISAFNLAMTLGIKTSSVWPLISWIMLAAFLYGLMELIYKRSWIIFVKDVTQKIFSFTLAFPVFLIITTLTIGNQLFGLTKIHTLELSDHQVDLTTLKPVYATQSYGRLSINKSLNGSTLSVAGKRFANGLGTHADSRIDYILPEKVQELSVIVGLDDEIESANVTFSVWGDEKLLWESSPFYGAEKDLQPVKIPINTVKKLSLRVSGMGDISSDHADWIQPVLNLEKN